MGAEGWPGSSGMLPDSVSTPSSPPYPSRSFLALPELLPWLGPLISPSGCGAKWSGERPQPRDAFSGHSEARPVLSLH